MPKPLIKPQAHIHLGLVTYNSASYLPTFYESLCAQTYPHWSLTVLNNAFKDDSLAITHQYFPQARLIDHPENLGFGRANNIIIKTCNMEPGDFYSALNPDVAIAPDYFEILIKTLQEKEAGWGTGILFIQDDDCQPTSKIYSAGHCLMRGGYAMNIGYRRLPHETFAQVREVFGAPAAALLYSQEMMADISRVDGNFFDAHMFMYLEDVDVDWRARRMGWHCWLEPAAVGYHSASRVRGMLLAHSLANRYLSILKNAYWQELWFYSLPMMLIHMLLRLILTPKVGWLFIKTWVKNAPHAWRKRYRPVVTRAEFLQWAKWSAEQPAGNPDSRNWFNPW
jgi:GT2 family glycosyltransferase